MGEVSMMGRMREGAMAGLILWLLLMSVVMSVSASILCSNVSNSCEKVAEDVVVVEVDGSAVLATTDEAFLCATLDWWPPEKCDYGTCAWDHASLLNLVSQNFESWLSHSSCLLGEVLCCLNLCSCCCCLRQSFSVIELCLWQ